MDIKDKVAIVTGASGGIGLAIARGLSKKGAKVVLAARGQEKLEAAAKELPGSLVVRADMRKPADIKSLIDKTIAKFGRVDILVNNAGQGMYGPVEKIDIEQYKEMMELNLYAIVRLMQGVIPIMREQKSGMILNISSRVSKNYFPALAAYASTKYALNAITLTARQELVPDKIIVSVFHPKMTATDFNVNALGEAPYWPSRPGPAPEIDTPEQVAEQVIKQIESEEPEEGM